MINQAVEYVSLPESEYTTRWAIEVVHKGKLGRRLAQKSKVGLEVEHAVVSGVAQEVV